MGSKLLALSHFDRFYPFIYTKTLWQSIRLALICKSKKMFVVNNCYDDKQKIISQMKMNGAIDFLKNFESEEKLYFENQNLTSKYQNITVGTQIDEFVKTTKYFGEKPFYTKKIDDLFVNYTSGFQEEENVKYLKKDLHKLKAGMIMYEGIEVPPLLTLLAYPKGVIKKDFPVVYDKFNQASFYPLDGFSVLVVLLMNIKNGDRILDMCAAPGGKTITMLQTGLPSELVCIDNEKSRITRLRNVIKTHTFPEDLMKVSVIHGNSVNETKYMNDYFDKVLVDAPCSTDRHAVSDKGFSLFSPQNDKKRINLFQSQRDLLRMAVKSCKIGGDILYSTCTLSPVQNDNVVVSVIKEVNDKETDFQLIPVNCHGNYFNRRNKKKNEDLNDWFSTFVTTDSIGQIILPNILNNYGPGYVCKIRKVSTVKKN